jgi:hypothetical protein
MTTLLTGIASQLAAAGAAGLLSLCLGIFR